MSGPILDIPAPRAGWSSSHTPRRDVRTLCRWLEGALPGGAGGCEALVERLRGPLAERCHLVAAALVVAHLRGEVEPRHWERLTGVIGATRQGIDAEMRAVWVALANAGLVSSWIGYLPRHPLTRRIVHRWACEDEWSLSPQDEDLLLMDDRYVPWLLEAGALPDETKDAPAIAEHHARDSAWGAVQRGLGLEGLAERFGAWAEVARGSSLPGIAEYLGRLASYGSPASCDRERAVRMLEDLARCYAPPPGTVEVEAVEGGWEGPLIGTSSHLSRRVRIDAATGRLRVLPSGP